MISKMKKAVVKFAQQYIGFEENPGNMGFKDKAFDTKMRQVGFKNTNAWCALFAELCWAMPTYSGKSKVFLSLSDNFSANAVRSYENFEKDDSGLFKTFNDAIPEPGDIVIWEKKKNGIPKGTGSWTFGHAGVVESANELNFVAIEGNSNKAGGREGIKVGRKTRTYNYDKQNGLVLKGFISCKV